MAQAPTKSFSPFLDAVQQKRVQTRDEALPELREGNAPAVLLALLLDARGPLPVANLLKESGLGLAEFYQALETMQKNDLVLITEVEGEEASALTPMGEKLAVITLER